jgi:Ca2+-binding RTX toxin-like protein
MRMRIKNALRLAVVGILLAGLLSGFGMLVLADNPPQLTTIEVTPINPSINVGQSLEFTASGKDQNGNPFPLSDPQWQGDTWHGTISVNLADPTKCTFTATATGDSYIMCWEGPPRQGPHGSTDITITQGSEQQLDSVVVSPANVNLEVGGQQLFSAVGYDLDGNPMDPPITPMWSTDGGTIAQDGTYTAPDTEGDYDVTAGVTGSTNTGTANVHVTVSDQQLDSVVVSPANVNLEVGGQQLFSAVGYDLDGNPMDPPITPMWSTDGGTIAQDGSYTAPDTEGDYEVTVSVSGSTVTCTASVHVTPPPVQARVDGNGVLQIKLQGDANVKVGVDENGNVLINGQPMGDPPVKAGDIKGINVEGGTGDNEIDLSGVTWDKFPSISVYTPPYSVQINGGSGDDTITGSGLGNEIDGGDGDDTINGGGWPDDIKGGSGNDRIDGGFGDDIIDGGVGNDIIDGGGNDDFIYGGAGDDRVNGGDGCDIIKGEAGADNIHGGDGFDMIYGGEGTDTIFGEGGNDVISGGDGGDWIDGGAGEDDIGGGLGNDVINGGGGHDDIDGGVGNDIINGGDGDDIVEDWWGDDTIVNQPGSDDIISDHDGNDTLDFSPAVSGITINMGLTGVDQVVDAAGNTVWLEGQFENFIGSEFDDVVFVDPLDVPRNLDGGDGTDTLNFDAKGVSVTDDGTTITAEGFAPVTYTNFETVNITNTSRL